MLKRLSRIIKSVVPINYEQAGIYAGDEGYDINVNKHTDLKGALITSTQKAEADGKNHFSTGSLTHSDIENRSNYSGSSFGVSGSVSANFETPLERMVQLKVQNKPRIKMVICFIPIKMATQLLILKE